MAHADFVHLRVHSAYSLLEGAIKIEELGPLCRAHGMPAVAVTDTRNLFGALQFSLAASDAGVQPIIGCELAIAPEKPGRRPGHPGPGGAAEPDKLVVLVQNEAGYRHLIKLLSKSYLDAEAAGVPWVRLDDFEDASDGLIALTGGPGGVIGRLLAEGQDQAAGERLARLKELFPGRLYVEVTRHGLEVERRIEGRLLDLAYEAEVPMVATSETFFADAGMFEAHDALICIAEGAFVADGARRKLTPEHRFKTAGEMRALFADLPEAADNTLVVAKRCAFKLSPRSPILPAFPVADGQTEAEALRSEAEEGLERRLETHVFAASMDEAGRKKAARPYRERLEYELGVIADMGYPGYFLIVADFIKWAKSNDIPVGPGRGSGAGSVVAWSLTITDLDPLRFGLLFERFLNPDRVTMPDFDIDFCQDRRDEVISYVQQKYGRGRVAQIITFGKLQERAALLYVGRVLQMPYPQVDRICKLVPNNPTAPVTIGEAVEGEPRLQEMRDQDPTVARMIDIARKLEGLYRHASIHAAGVVIGDRSLDELIPLYRDPRSDMPVTQFSMKYVEKSGLVKFDFLGLKTLSVLALACELIAGRGDAVDVTRIPLDDPKTYAILSRAETVGVFQLESSGMRDVLRRLRPDRFEDIIAVVALYRPGPMDNIPSYISRKHGEEAADYLYPSLEGILKETFGIMIYQEQVMQIAQELAGYSLGGADLLRRAMGKKIRAEMDAQRKSFVDGAVARGVSEMKAEEIFAQMSKFAGYGFNKSHAAAYALVAYQTAYLKANYPVEFLAASMTFDLGNTDKLNIFRQELDRLGIPLLPPDINRSRPDFGVETEVTPEGPRHAIRYALAAVKNVGEGAMESLVAEREAGGPFKDLGDFADRADTRMVNKRQIENLACAGAFDALEPNRHRVCAGAETIVRLSAAAASERDSAQESLFGNGAGGVAKVELVLPEVEDWADMERLTHELEAIGFHLSGHPLDAYGSSLERLHVLPSAELQDELDRDPGRKKVAGIVIGKQERTSRQGNRFAFVQLSDTSGSYEVVIFSEVLSASREFLEAGEPLLLTVEGRSEGESLRLMASDIAPLAAAVAEAGVGLKLFLSGREPLDRVKAVLEHEPRGRGRIALVLDLADGQEVELELPDSYRLSPDARQEIKTLAGIEVRDL